MNAQAKPLPFVNRGELFDSTGLEEFMFKVEAAALTYFVKHEVSGEECCRFLDEVLLDGAGIEPDCSQAWQLCHQGLKPEAVDYLERLKLASAA